ncbi:hypothetical protein [Empedobacter brevis]|uniref:hypothetical protein n=1 Tax=Empedobacter brevis TaxID=247 RepID=UPI0028D09875|nr:hypothetical protein [Empedobacter brevis]
MTIEEILNNYAFNQGLENWEELENCSNNLTFHIKEVAQLIQDELKKKIATSDHGLELYNSEYDKLEVSILNTENIK